MSLETPLLRAILATLARQVFSREDVSRIIGSAAGDKQLRAYNLCDGTRTQAEITRELGLDPGNFSRTLSRWVDEGIVIRTGEARDALPLHVYPVPEGLPRKAAKA